MFSEFKINDGPKSMSSLCNVKGFSLQNHQRFLSKYVSTIKPVRLLLYHGLGSGKTCSSLTIIKSLLSTFKGKKKVLVITPASLKANYMKELDGPCGKGVSKANVDVVSYQSFTNDSQYENMKDTIVIVDEVQNIVSESGMMYKIFMQRFAKRETPGCHMFLLSGTPMFDKTFELALLGNLLLTRDEYITKRLPIKAKEFYMKFDVRDNKIRNRDKLLHFFKGRVSHFKGAHPASYPKKVEHDEMCVMSDKQYGTYTRSIGAINFKQPSSISTTFLIGPRQAANVVYPNGKITKSSAIEYNNKKFSSKIHAIKLNQCLERVNKNTGTHFVYSNFVNPCGVETFVSFLKHEHMYNEATGGETTQAKRYGIFRTGKTEQNNKLLKLFNDPKNKDGSYMKVIIGSPAMKEGVTLLRVRQVHVLDPYWNRSRTEQIMGRAVRFCSHKNVPVNERQVDVYHYHSVSKDPKEITVDLHIRAMAAMKQRQISLFEQILKEAAIDCELFKNANEPPSINCAKSTNGSKRVQSARSLISPNVSIVGGKTMISSSKTKPKRKTREAHEVKLKLNHQQKKTQRVVKKSAPGCPSNRMPDSVGNCPAKYPFKKRNKKGSMCCFKRGKTSINNITMKNIQNGRFKTQCAKHTKKELVDLAKRLNIDIKRGTKKMLCERLNNL